MLKVRTSVEKMKRHKPCEAFVNISLHHSCDIVTNIRICTDQLFSIAATNTRTLLSVFQESANNIDNGDNNNNIGDCGITIIATKLH